MMDIGTILPSSDRFGKYTCKPKTFHLRSNPQRPHFPTKHTQIDVMWSLHRNVDENVPEELFKCSDSAAAVQMKVPPRLRRTHGSLDHLPVMMAVMRKSRWWRHECSASALCWVRQLICSNINWTDAESLTLLHTPPSCLLLWSPQPSSSSGRLSLSASGVLGELGHPSGSH